MVCGSKMGAQTKWMEMCMWMVRALRGSGEGNDVVNK